MIKKQGNKKELASFSFAFFMMLFGGIFILQLFSFHLAFAQNIQSDSQKNTQPDPQKNMQLESQKKETKAESPSIATKKTQTAKSEGGFKKSVVLDYHSWFENLKYTPNGGSQVELKTVSYGFAVSYDVTQYYARWGWGLEGGAGQGYGVGQSSSSYLQKRVPWTYWRAGARVFSRINNRMDIGIHPIVWRRSISWPAGGGSVEAGPNMLLSLFLEFRWRLSREWELVQALGTSTNNVGANLRLGAGYSF